MIEIKNVSKTYNGKKKVLKNISFKIEGGEIFAFIGLAANLRRISVTDSKCLGFPH